MQEKNLFLLLSYTCQQVKRNMSGKFKGSLFEYYLTYVSKRNKLVMKVRCIKKRMTKLIETFAQVSPIEFFGMHVNITFLKGIC